MRGRAAFDERDAMPALLGVIRNAQADDAAANDQDVFRHTINLTAKFSLKCGRMRPTGITADKTRAVLSVNWEDGHASELPFKLLSDACPCATCNAERNDPNPLKILRPHSYELEAINPVGNYAINIMWKGGCRYGIYSWDFLEKLATMKSS